MFQILAPSGEPVGGAVVDDDRLASLFEAMVVARTYDRKSMALQRQGRLATYAPFEGQEAAQVGAAAALRPDDWMVATYRDAAAMWMHGYPMELLFAGRTGHEQGGSPPAPVPVLPPSITVGGHMVHAVGLAWAERLKGSDRVAITLFGDGATSEGDFHEALNFAGVFGVGCVFLCQNNGWAISMPREAQTAAETISGKGPGYGVPGIQVDGNDVLAVQRVTAEALDRARTGGGPTLIEAVTYRLGPHTTSDDPDRYRPSGALDPWTERDPLRRARLRLERVGIWSEAWEAGIADAASATVNAAIDAAEALPDPGPEHLFEEMFAEMPPHLLDQLRDARGER